MNPIRTAVRRRRHDAATPRYPGGFDARTFSIGFVLAVTFGLSMMLGADGARAATSYPIAIEAGISGAVTTLQCYDPEPNRNHPIVYGKPDPFAPCRSTDDNLDNVTGAHAGYGRPTDIAAGSGTTYLQIDYLPDRDRGGYAYAVDVSGACGAYVGQTIEVYVYHYDPTGSHDTHEVYYEHINSTVSLSTWLTWNNYYSSNPLWASWLVNFYLHNSTTGGLQIGTLATPAWNTPPSCATGTHLHQDTGTSHSESWNTSRWAEGCYNDGGAWGGSRCPTNPSVWAWVAGEAVTGRISDIQFQNISLN